MNRRIPELSSALAGQLQEKIDQKTKPLGSLGVLEAIAKQIALIQDTMSPAIKLPHVLLFAGDHGLAQEGVSPYPQDVTQQMLRNFTQGGAAINVFCRQHQLALKVIDCGVRGGFDHNTIIDARIAAGTCNILHEPAMTSEQLNQAMANGQRLVAEIARQGCNVVIFGEMGIGNSSSAALISARLLGQPVEDLICPGAGCDNTGLAHKKEILRRASQAHPDCRSPLEVMQTFGGFELATALGAFGEAASRRMTILVDGFIMGSVALTASRLEPRSRDFMIFGHQSASSGHQHILSALKATPLLNLGLRLGEGTGAALALPLLQSAVAFLNEMASFSEAEVSQRE